MKDHRENMDNLFKSIKEKVAAGTRIDDVEALALFESHDLLVIGELAAEANRRKNGDKVYFNVNRHINYTNLCVNRCTFCAFSKESGETGEYTLALQDVREKAEQAATARATEIHIVGGLHPELPFEFYLQMLRSIKEVSAALHIKAFTAVEIDYFSELAELSIPEVIAALKEAGLGSLPGGGAEIFAPAVRDKICPEKISGERWLEVTEQVHLAGLKSNAT
ncbi:MAG: radical SAM protein, partial [Geopsychrobacter sp.]|nr:radical SAM protein [Geopsychrobacter sp.]